MEAVIFIGIQGSGKSTFYKERFFRTHVRISLDMLKTRRREQLLLDACVTAKQPFVIDNTNPTLEDRQRYIAAATLARFKIVGFYFSSKVAEALQRNALRSGKERIPERGVWGTAGRLVLPSLSEGFDALHYVKIEDGGFIVEAWRDEI